MQKTVSNDATVKILVGMSPVFPESQHSTSVGHCGDGPCTAVVASTFCRSTFCTLSGLCAPSSSYCYVDADCTGGNFCLIFTGTCTPQQPNGVSIPDDPPHTNPTLNGICTPTAAALVCKSGLCDVNDNKCRYGEKIEADLIICSSFSHCRSHW
jgi:hypothetical protein